ncbi:MAG TPA: hypothetical protein PLG34_13890, partial [Spirochaetota bacterium]|nr:hypothetical protein [Spirochaetota bacterium]
EILMNNLSDIISTIGDKISYDDKKKYLQVQKAYIKGLIKTENIENAIKYYRKNYDLDKVPLFIEPNETLPPNYFEKINMGVVNANAN